MRRSNVVSHPLQLVFPDITFILRLYERTLMYQIEALYRVLYVVAIVQAKVNTRCVKQRVLCLFKHFIVSFYKIAHIILPGFHVKTTDFKS